MNEIKIYGYRGGYAIYKNGKRTTTKIPNLEEAKKRYREIKYGNKN